MKVYIFKTSIRHQVIGSVDNIIRTLIPNTRWNFDLEDCDNILRVESRRDISEEICNGLAKFGFFCQELQ